MNLEELTKKLNELAVLYNKTKKLKYREQWYALLKRVA